MGIPAEPHTLAAAPDGVTVLATTAQGLLRSADAGPTWAAVDGAPLLQVVNWADASMAVGVDPAGAVWTSTDAADTWQQTAELGAAAVGAAPAVAEDHLLGGQEDVTGVGVARRRGRRVVVHGPNRVEPNRRAAVVALPGS